jgi:hypothetical protein
VPDQPTITDEIYAAYRAGRHEHRLLATHLDGPNAFGGECCDRAGLAAAAPHIAAQALRSGEERVRWSVWEHRPSGPSVHTLLSEPVDEDEEQWARCRAAEIRADGGSAEVRRQVTTVFVGAWEPVNLPCPTCNGAFTRETVGMVCQTCGTDYAAARPGSAAPDPH